MAPSHLPWAPYRAPLQVPPRGPYRAPERGTAQQHQGAGGNSQLGEEPGASAASAWASAWLGCRLSAFGLDFHWISAAALISAGFCFDFDLI